MSTTQYDESTRAEEKLESGTAHARAALDTTAAAVKEVIETSRTQARQAISTGKEHLGHAAKDLGEAARATASEIRTQINFKADEVKERAQIVQSDTEQFIRKKPLQAVGIAAAVGFVIAMIVRR